ncbi:fumarylacetoacetate hydrolase family protein [Streptomyces sp. NPDC051985]|uniref:fumarylacetoacetate hydrolase family protein n=1 Tax=Streptomyces sp. NPDC051985 TaxID=3155807 RepID=UPI003445235B
MKLGRVEIGAEEFVVTVEGDLATPVATGDPAALVDMAAGRRNPAPIGAPVPLSSVRVLAPVSRPPSIRDFMAFEAHARDASLDGKVDPGWYEHPVFYFTNPHAVRGPEEEIVVPAGTRCLDYELEVAAVIGAEASDLAADDPATLDVICGFTILNDWTARDIQVDEMRKNLGPVKGKDFATSIGPFLVTPDEFDDFRSGRPKARMAARVNGERWSLGELSDIHFSWAEILAYASRNTRLVPGDVLGSGTVGTGCILELRQQGMRETRKWLKAGDLVELEVDGIGTLRNRIAARPG